MSDGGFDPGLGIISPDFLANKYSFLSNFSFIGSQEDGTEMYENLLGFFNGFYFIQCFQLANLTKLGKLSKQINQIY